VASFGQILPRALLEVPRYRCLNLHPSLLPRFRGASPIESAILDGVDETGTSLMLMVQKMDAGPVLGQKRLAISPAETAGELTARLATLSGELLLETLPGWVRGDVTTRDQDEHDATYTVRITKQDGWVDWSCPAETIARRVRAFNPWPVAHTVWSGRSLRLLRAHARAGSAPPGHVVGVEDGGLVIGTGSGLLVVGEMQLAGGRPAPAAALVRGYPQLLGATLPPEATWSSG
jgi:methionyl-tRNA formyltransferase